jgi:dihydrofolate reductase
MKCSVFIATSLDGFIADSKGSIAWLEKANASLPAGEDCGYRSFLSSIDVIVMGRKSFEQVMTFSEWPYSDLPMVVVSRTLRSLTKTTPATVTLKNADPAAIVTYLHGRGYKSAYIDGGKLIQSFLSAGLINEMTITLIPVVLGGGTSLFGALERPIWVTLENSKAYPFGFVQNRFRVSASE